MQQTHQGISLAILLTMTMATPAFAYEIEQFFHIYPGMQDYVIAYSCPFDSMTGERYTVHPVPPIDASITHVGEVRYDTITGRATVSITANEPSNITFGSFEYGCRLVGE